MNNPLSSNLQPGIFNISLDFELHWGCFETMKVMDDKTKRYFLNTRKAIPKMLQLFEQYGLHVTWAAVGMLYRKNATEWKNGMPQLIPTFQNPEVSAYEWVNRNGFLEEEDLFHFAPSIIDLILSTPHQEVGTHTYAHYFCLEKGQTQEQFKADLQMAVSVAASKGIKLHSLVFPRNQYNAEYLEVCTELGIRTVRTNPAIWYWSYSDNAGSFIKRFFRAGDAYLKLQPIKMVKWGNIDARKIPLELPASRLYRPWRPEWPMLNKWKMQRIKNEMTKAAQQSGYYHIWWHPHNFGNYPQQCLLELEQIGQHYQYLKKEFGFESLTMKETTEKILHHTLK